jgi:methylamine dehydrogenase accessory protein MauD
VSAVGWLGDDSTAQLVGLIGGVVVLGLLAAAQAAQGLFLTHLLRQNGRLLVRIEALEGGLPTDVAVPAPSENEAQPEPGLPLGSQAPGFALSGIYGETLTLDSLRARGKPVMLLFTNPDCEVCTALLPEIGGWQQEHDAELTVALVSRGTAEENRARSLEHGLANVLLQEAWEVADPYQVKTIPSAVLVGPDGTIGSPLAVDPENIRALVRQTVGTPAGTPAKAPEQATEPTAAPAPSPSANGGNLNGQAAAQSVPAAAKVKIGAPAPPLRLPDLEGNTVNLAGFKGKETLVLFWNPGSSFCQQMLDDLKALEADPPKGAPRLLVVSHSTVEANRTMGFRSPVVLDQTLDTGRAFGASGTPSAVLVDRKGNVASEVAVGAPAVLELARGRKSEV